MVTNTSHLSSSRGRKLKKAGSGLPHGTAEVERGRMGCGAWGGVDAAWRRRGALPLCVLPLAPAPPRRAPSSSLGLLVAFPSG